MSIVSLVHETKKDTDSTFLYGCVRTDKVMRSKTKDGPVRRDLRRGQEERTATVFAIRRCSNRRSYSLKGLERPRSAEIGAYSRRQRRIVLAVQPERNDEEDASRSKNGDGFHFAEDVLGQGLDRHARPCRLCVRGEIPGVYGVEGGEIIHGRDESSRLDDCGEINIGL